MTDRSADVSPPVVPFAELHAKSAFSFLRATATPEALVARAVELGLLPAYDGADADRGGAYQFRFTQAPQLTADAGYANRDAIEAYRAGMRSMTDILSSGSKTLDQHLDEVEAEEVAIRDRLQRSNLPREVFGLLTPNGNPQPSNPPAE